MEWIGIYGSPFRGGMDSKPHTILKLFGSTLVCIMYYVLMFGSIYIGIDNLFNLICVFQLQ